MCHFYYKKSDTKLSEVRHGSNESFYYPNEESGPNLRKGTPLQKSFEKVDVYTKQVLIFEKGRVNRFSLLVLVISVLPKLHRDMVRTENFSSHIIHLLWFFRIVSHVKSKWCRNSVKMFFLPFSSVKATGDSSLSIVTFRIHVWMNREGQGPSF